MRKHLTRYQWRSLNDRIESLVFRMCIQDNSSFLKNSQYISFNIHPSYGRVFALSKKHKQDIINIDIAFKALQDKTTGKVNILMSPRYKGNQSTVEYVKYESEHANFEIRESYILYEEKPEKTPFEYMKKVHSLSNGIVLRRNSDSSEIYRSYLAKEISSQQYQAELYLKKIIDDTKNWKKLETITQKVFEKLF